MSKAKCHQITSSFISPWVRKLPVVIQVSSSFRQEAGWEWTSMMNLAFSRDSGQFDELLCTGTSPSEMLIRSIWSDRRNAISFNEWIQCSFARTERFQALAIHQYLSRNTWHKRRIFTRFIVSSLWTDVVNISPVTSQLCRQKKTRIRQSIVMNAPQAKQARLLIH